MRRLLSWLLFAAGSMAAGGCAPEGSYRLAWVFIVMDGSLEGSMEAPSIGCGAHGVDAIRIQAVGSEGQQDAIVPCTDGVTVRKILAATWAFNIHALGPDGGFKEPLPKNPLPDDPPPLLHEFLDLRPIAADKETDLGTVAFKPQPACRDGVDNDRDGRVDNDDPQCAGRPDGPTESEPPPMP